MKFYILILNYILCLNKMHCVNRIKLWLTNHFYTSPARATVCDVTHVRTKG